MIELSDHLRSHLSGQSPFDDIMRLEGEEFRHHKNRRTIRCVIGGRPYFVKTHRHTDWIEILKNVLRGRAPTLTSQPEWRAIRRLRELGVATMTAAGMGIRGVRPAWVESFLITEELTGMVHLDEMAKESTSMGQAAARLRLKRAAIAELAAIARAMHEGGVNHRDFYLCHFMLPRRDFSTLQRGEKLHLHVIDLHRSQVRSTVPNRMILRDLSGLLFSALDFGISATDQARFWRDYAPGHWKDVFRRQPGFMARIVSRARRLYSSEHGRAPRLPASLASS